LIQTVTRGPPSPLWLNFVIVGDLCGCIPAPCQASCRVSDSAERLGASVLLVSHAQPPEMGELHLLP
jgi:hypothetical protein